VIEWTEPAIQQLNQSYDYIALTNSETVAVRIVEHILASVQRLAVFPQSGRRGRVPQTRELVITDAPFIVAYTIEDSRILILAVYHSARQWPETF
jgi:plasmid stabilization system protein ParE